jgi:hypothetical protein
LGFLIKCCLCGGSFGDGRPYIGTSGVAFPSPHPLFQFCDAGMHLDCLEKWPHRLEFSNGYFVGKRTMFAEMGTLLAEGTGWILGCGPSSPGRDPHYAEVDLSDWPCRLYSLWPEWNEFLNGGFSAKLSGAACRAATAVMREVAEIAPDLNALQALRLRV